MPCTKLAPLTIFTLAALAAAAPARADGYAFARTGSGPGDGRGATAVAMGPLVAGGQTLPALTFDYARGLGDHFDFVGSVDLGLLLHDAQTAVLGAVDLGLRARVTRADSVVHAGLALSPEFVFFAGDSALALFGVAPAVFLGGGTPDLQVTFGLDVPMYFAGAVNIGPVAGAGTGLAVTLRPHLTVESAVSPTLGLFLSGSVQVAVAEDVSPLFALVTGGVTF